MPIYDETTGQINCYCNLQDKCINKLDIKEGDRILCAGSGTGNEIARMLAKSKCFIIGVDYSQPSINRARNKFKGCSDVIFELGNLHKLKFEDNLFDRVSCICVLDFVKDQIKVIGEISRVLKVNGKLVITYPLLKKPTVTINLLKDSATDLRRLWKFFRFFISFLPLVFLPKHKTLALDEIKKNIS